MFIKPCFTILLVRNHRYIYFILSISVLSGVRRSFKIMEVKYVKTLYVVGAILV